MTGDQTARRRVRTPEPREASIPRRVAPLRTEGSLAYPAETTPGLGARTPGGHDAP